MFKTLEKFKFGDKFISMIKLLYNKNIFKINNNGWISKSCEMKRGIRQGYPVSALLFIFVVEIMRYMDLNSMKKFDREYKII